MAMNNGNQTPNNGHHNTNFETQARILQEMNREQAVIVHKFLMLEIIMLPKKLLIIL
ncbi:MAG: hypothetical protein ACQKHC_00665 [Candidatus Phytoplasma pruni]